MDSSIHLELDVPSSRVKSRDRAVVVAEQCHAQLRHVLGAEDLPDRGVDHEAQVARGRVEAGDQAAPAADAEHALGRGVQAPDLAHAGVGREAHGARGRLQARHQAPVASAERELGAHRAGGADVPPHSRVYVIQHLPGGRVHASHPASLLGPCPASPAQNLARAGQVGEGPDGTNAKVSLVAHVPCCRVHARDRRLRAPAGQDHQAVGLREHRARVLADASV
mmetsp:Transcript_103097/g.300699  ORF Transcript_103097/g.300699 Transcript_103097/m.300699 type:complete len:223 (+) Transcript_103097:210-878(+)